MSYPAISLSTATVGRHRCPQNACRPPANLPSTQIRARIIAPVTPSPPSAVLTPSIPVLRWIRAKAKKHWKNLITISVLRPISPFAILSGPYHPHHLHSCSKHGAEITQRLLPPQSHGEEPPHPPEPLPPGPRPPGVARAASIERRCQFLHTPVSGWVSGGRVSPCSSAIASSRFRMRSSVTSHDRLLPSLGWPSLSLRHSSTSGHAAP